MLRVRLTDVELAGLDSKRGGLTMSEFVRMAVLQWQAPMGIRCSVFPSTEKEAPEKVGKICKHGTAKGYNCWQCGGLAVVE